LRGLALIPLWGCANRSCQSTAEGCTDPHRVFLGSLVRYCSTLRVSADRAVNRAAHTRAKPRFSTCSGLVV